MLVTWRMAFTSPSILSIRCSTAGSVTCAPPDVWKTICSVSPEIRGEAAWRMRMAWVDGVLGSEKLSE